MLSYSTRSLILGRISRSYSTKVLPASCDALVIGGGVIGLSTAYHLNKLGLNNVIVVERNEITSGTTWHSNGLVWRLRPSETDVKLLSRTHELLTKELAAHAKVDATGWINNGGLFLAHNTKRMQEYQRLNGLSHYFGIESRILDRNQTIELLKPLIDEKSSDLVGGLYSPGDGFADPYTYCSALIKAGDLKVWNNCRVTAINTTENKGIESQQRKVESICLEYGGNVEQINTNVVINCTGCWAPQVAKLAGIQSIPQETMEHAWIMTEAIDGINPSKTPNIRDHDLSIAFRVCGQSLCMGGYEPNPQLISEKIDSLQAYTLFDLNWDKFGINMENSIKLMPMLSKIGIKSTTCGPESFTPDHKPLMGEDIQVRGFYHNTGFNSFGISLSGGAGYQMAKWVVEGSPDCDMTSYDIKRFNRALVNNRAWSQVRCREAYERNYGIVYHLDEPISGREHTFKDVLYDTLLKKGCVYCERHGTQTPDWFDLEPSRLSTEDCIALDSTYEWSAMSRQWKAVLHECQSCHERAIVVNLSSMAKFDLIGGNASQVIASLCHLDPKSMSDQSTAYAYVVNSKGGIDSEVVINKVNSNQYRITCPNVLTNRVMSKINNLINDEVITNTRLIDCSQNIAILSVNGPKSKIIIENCLDLSLDGIEERTHREFKVEDVSIRVIRLSMVSDIGWQIHLNNNRDLKTIYERLIAHPLLIDAGLRAYDSLKNENRYLSAGIDLRTEDMLSDIGIHSFEQNTDKSYNRSNDRSMDKCFVWIRLQTSNQSPIVWGLEPIWHNSRVIGLVRKSFYSHINQQMMAFGHINRNSGFSLPSEVEIEILGNRYKARLQRINARV